MKKLYIYILLTIASTSLLQAQVTIGSGNSPAKGLLLQIKDTEPTDPDTNNETVTRGGLVLPRVSLVKENTLDPFITNATPDQMKAHEGLLVYNTNKCLNHKGNDNGLYGWYGTSWRKMGEEEERHPEVKEFIDPRDDEVYLYRQFGGAGEWMIENMRATTYVGGGTAPVENNDTSTNPTAYITRYFIYPNGSQAIFNKHPEYGLLYNWSAATNRESTAISLGQGVTSINGTVTPVGQRGPNNLRGVCPDGWHLPNDEEWNKLEAELTNNSHLYSSNSTPITWDPSWDFLVSAVNRSNARLVARACNVEGKEDKVTNGLSYNYGFNAYLAGDSNHDGNSPTGNYGRSATFWTSSFASGNLNVNHTAWCRLFYPIEITSGMHRAHHVSSLHFSVRCKKN